MTTALIARRAALCLHDEACALTPIITPFVMFLKKNRERANFLCATLNAWREEDGRQQPDELLRPAQPKYLQKII